MNTKSQRQYWCGNRLIFVIVNIFLIILTYLSTFVSKSISLGKHWTNNFACSRRYFIWCIPCHYCDCVYCIFQSATFDPEQYIEQLAWRTQGGDSKEGPQDFDAKKMLRAFENTIEELKLLSMRMEERTGKLDANIRAETKSHAKRVAQLQENNKVLIVLKLIIQYYLSDRFTIKIV